MTSRSAIVVLLASGLACWLSACASLNTPQPLLRVAATKAGTEVAIHATEGGQIADIRCPRGIGWAEFVVPAGVRFDRIEFRLHVRGLEGCTVERDGNRVHVSVSSHGDLAIRQWREDGRPVTAGERVSVTAVAVSGGPPVIPLDGWFELRLPDAGEAECAVRLEWVDFYR